jgi:NitT/TauT family transport system substrate-binding protein
MIIHCLHYLARNLLMGSVLAVAFTMGPAFAADGTRIRIAIGDIPGVDTFNTEAAAARARERGVDVTIIYLQSEDIAAQAVLKGLVDVGMGTPYGLIQQTDAPLRMFYQLNTLRFFPVVNTDYYKSWNDLNGAEIYTHGPGSGTEAIMNLMAKKHGLRYGSMIYLPGSGVRVGGMLHGRIKATIVDTHRRNQLLREGKGKFAVLPMPDIHASDEILYAHRDFLRDNAQAVSILLEELLRVWRETISNPSYILGARKKYNLLPELPESKVQLIEEYYSEMVSVGAFPKDGGGAKAATADFEFFTFAGTIQDDPSGLKIEDYWDLNPLDTALERLSKYVE